MAKPIIVFLSIDSKDELSSDQKSPDFNFLHFKEVHAFYRQLRKSVPTGLVRGIWISSGIHPNATMKIIHYLKAKSNLFEIPLILSINKKNPAIKWFSEISVHLMSFPYVKNELRTLFNSLLTQKKLTGTKMLCGDFIIGNHPTMETQIEMAKSAMNHPPATILITGETGTGKTVLARGLHASSNRKDGPFIDVNCSAIPESLIDSELFGHAKGAFTGASFRKKGLFELADQGTIFLDEIGEMPLVLQAKLLKVIEDKKIRPIGANFTVDLNLNIICATNIDLKSSIKKRSFRPDLYYRISPIKVNLPPLNERLYDLKTFIAFWWRMHGDRINIDGINENMVSILMDYHFPGNIRELFNILYQASLRAGDNLLEADHLPIELVDLPSTNKMDEHFNISLSFPPGTGYIEARNLFEKQLLEVFIQLGSGKMNKAAEVAKLSRRGFYKAMERIQKSQSGADN